MKIGTITLDNPTVLAPLAGITNLPMRLLARSAGCALVYSEMISANGLVYGTAKTGQLLASAPEEKPLNVQLFGSDPTMLAEAAQKAAAAGADMVDINFGCAVKKILKSGSGVALMRDLPKAAALLTAVRAAVTIPLTVKMRAGWDPSGDEALALARIAEGCGVDAVAVHPRTARQGFSGRADWSLISRIKGSVHIPVIGNGDVTTAEDAARMLTQTGCDAVMVGRAAIGNPFIFEQIRDLLAGRATRAVAPRKRFAAMECYVRSSVACLGEQRACFLLRSRLGWFVKGLPGASAFRQAIRPITSEAQAMTLLKAFEAGVLETAAGPSGSCAPMDPIHS
jgi:tRNA-dihydrouridine synthase B